MTVSLVKLEFIKDRYALESLTATTISPVTPSAPRGRPRPRQTGIAMTRTFTHLKVPGTFRPNLRMRCRPTLTNPCPSALLSGILR